MRTGAHRRIWWLLVALCAAQLVWSAVAAATVERAMLDQGRPTGRFSQSPDRAEIDAPPGTTLKIPISLTNYIDSDVDISVSITDIGASTDDTQLAQIVESSQYGAGDWIRSEVTETRMQSLEQLNFDLIVTVPDDAPVGTNMAGMVVEVTPVGADSGDRDQKVAFRFSGLTQIYLTVPGDITRATTITKTAVSDSFRIGGERFVVYEFELRNAGNVNDHVSGAIEITSMFGNRVKRLPVRDLLVLRDSTRTYRAVWTDTPRFGRFSATARLSTDEEKLTKDFPTVTLLPPWWWLALIVAALLVPVVWRWWQRRRDLALLLEELGDGWDADDGVGMGSEI